MIDLWFGWWWLPDVWDAFWFSGFILRVVYCIFDNFTIFLVSCVIFNTISTFYGFLSCLLLSMCSDRSTFHTMRIVMNDDSNYIYTKDIWHWDGPSSLFEYSNFTIIKMMILFILCISQLLMLRVGLILNTKSGNLFVQCSIFEILITVFK